MKPNKGLFLLFAATVAFSAIGFALWREHGRALAYRELAVTVSSVTNVTIYDLESSRSSSVDLASVPSTQFPMDIFSAAGSAEYHNPLLGTIWKGSDLAVLQLRDGTQRRLNLSFYGGFFSIEGVPGLYVVPGGHGSQFNATFRRLIQEQFVPKREQQKKNTSSPVR